MLIYECLLTIGAAGWLFDSPAINLLYLNNSAQLVIYNNTILNTALEDGTALMYAVSSVTLNVNKELGVKTIMDPDATLKVKDHLDLRVSMPVKIEGTVDGTGEGGNSSHTKITFEKSTWIRPQKLQFNSLHIGEEGIFTLLDPDGLLSLECEEVIIDGNITVKWLENIGWLVFNTGPKSHMYIDHLLPDGILKSDQVQIDGILEFQTPLNITGQIRDNIERFAVGGRLVLDAPSHSNNSWRGVSNVGIHSLVISGTILAGHLSITDIGHEGGMDNLEVQAGGVFKFQPASDFLCDNIDISGHMESFLPLVIDAHKREQHDTYLKVGESGRFVLDSLGQHITGPWSGNSSIKGGTFISEADSTIQLGQVLLHILYIEWGGTVHADPVTSIRVNYFLVTSSGHVEMVPATQWKGHSVTRVETFTVDGYLKHDTMANHNTRDWTGTSVLEARYVSIGGAVYAGLFAQKEEEPHRDRWLSLNVSGLLEMEPDSVFTINIGTVSGTIRTYTDMAEGRHWIGDDLTVTSSGLMDLDFKGAPKAPDLGSPQSQIEIGNKVILDGKLHAGSLYVSCNDIEIGSIGEVDVSEGGYASSYGPGKSFLSRTLLRMNDMVYHYKFKQ